MTVNEAKVEPPIYLQCPHLHVVAPSRVHGHVEVGATCPVLCDDEQNHFSAFVGQEFVQVLHDQSTIQIMEEESFKKYY